MEQPGLAAKLLEEGITRRARQRAGHLETLDRDRLIKAQVPRAVHDAEPALANDFLDGEALGDRMSLPPKGVAAAHRVIMV